MQKKGYRRVAGVSACRCNLEATKKSRLSLKKLTFCPRARPAAAQRIIVNKVRNLLISLIKITSPDSNDRDRSRDVRRSHLPLKIGAAGSRRLKGTMVAMFLLFWACPASSASRREVFYAIGAWACQLTNQDEGFGTKKFIFAVGF